MALTNRVDPEYNYENIMRDFDIFIVSKESKQLEKTNILDLLQEKFNALSVLYSFGQKSYVLFVKDRVSRNDLREAFESVYDDITIIKVTLSDLYNPDFCDKHFYYKNRMLAQLLLNSIRSPRNKGFEYNNLTGKLYYRTPNSIERWGDKKEIVRIKLLQISLDMGMYLNIDEKSFLRCKEPETEKKRKYVLDKKTQNFRRMLSTDKGTDVYVEGNFKKRGRRIKYLNINSFTSFTKCRLGVLHQFLQDVEYYLGDYMQLTLLSRDNLQVYEETQKIKPEVSKKQMGDLLNQKGINFVDLIQSSESEELMAFVSDYLEKEYGISLSYGVLRDDMFNVRIIHDEEYYENNGFDDPYDVDFGLAIVQHLTVESLSDIKKPMDINEQRKCLSSICDKIVQELILKNDVREKTISIYDWPRLSFNKNWTFVQRARIPDSPNADNKTIKSRKKSEHEYYCVQIDKCGNMEFSYIRNDHPVLCPIFEDLAAKIKNYGDLEGFVYSTEENIHAIISSKEKTMPDIAKIWRGLKDTNEKSLVSRDTLISAIEEVTEMDPLQFAAYSQEVIANLKTLDPLIAKKSLKSVIKIGTKKGKAMNRMLNEHFGIWIYSEIRDSDFDEVYRLRDIAGIQYCTETDDLNKQFFNYFVGPKRTGLNTSFTNASVIRKVYTADGTNEFKDLLPLMSIEFVRNGMYTVLPFPFKYLREYKLLLERKGFV